MKLKKDQGHKHVHFADNPKVHAYSPGTTLSSTSSKLRTPSDNGTLPLPSMPNHVSQRTTWLLSFMHVPSPVLVPQCYMFVGSPLRVVHVVYCGRAPAIPTIHLVLTCPPFQWDVRTTALPTTLTRDQPLRSEPAFKFSPPLASISITLRFTTPRGAVFMFTHTIAGARHVVDVLRAVHDTLYTRVDRPRDRAAEVARGYHDGGLCRVDLYPVSLNRVNGVRLYFVGLEWGG